MKIKSIKYKGRKDVYDVISSKTGNFLLSNGVVVHNCGTLDEANDMQMVEKSKKISSKNYYDAAEESYREILERMNSRFPWEHLARQGKKNGFITLIGQARYPDSFLERKILEAKKFGDESTIFWLRKTREEAQPKNRYSQEKFPFDLTNKRVIDVIEKEGICEICGKKFDKAFIGNKGKLVCSIDCYQETFFKKTEVKIEKF